MSEESSAGENMTPIESQFESAGQAPPVERSLADGNIIRGVDFANPRDTLERLANDTSKLHQASAYSTESSLRRWGELQTQEEHAAALTEWDTKMNAWAERIREKNPDVYAQIVNITSFISGQRPEGDLGSEAIQWRAFHEALHSGQESSVEAYIRLLKTMPDVHQNYDGLKKVARIFGKEAYHELFEAQTGEEYQDSRLATTNQAIENQYKKGKITEETRDKLRKKAQERATGKASEGEGSSEYLVGAVEIDSAFSAKERKRIKEILRTIPPDLLKKIKDVHKLGDDEGGIHQHFGFQSQIGISSTSLSGLDEGRDVMYHEILGHGLRDFISKIDRDDMKELQDLWGDVSESMIRKDTYARKYLDNDPKYKDSNYDRQGIPAEVDEFWSDRMAEYWHSKVTGKSTEHHRDQNNSFSAEEQAYIDKVCERTFDIYQKAAKKKAEFDDERRKYDELSFLGKIKANVNGQKPRLAWTGSIPKAA